jgi:hypothetical protein
VIGSRIKVEKAIYAEVVGVGDPLIHAQSILAELFEPIVRAIV